MLIFTNLSKDQVSSLSLNSIKRSIMKHSYLTKYHSHLGLAMVLLAAKQD